MGALAPTLAGREAIDSDSGSESSFYARETLEYSWGSHGSLHLGVARRSLGKSLGTLGNKECHGHADSASWREPYKLLMNGT